MGKLYRMDQLLGIGTDICSIQRFRDAKYPERIASYYLTPLEWQEAQMSTDVAITLASRFAVKEAVIKAAPDHLRLIDFSIVKDGPKPKVNFAEKLPYKFYISISHEQEFATATAICVAKS